MESLARFRAGVAGTVIGVVVIAIGLLTSGSGVSVTSSEGLGWLPHAGTGVDHWRPVDGVDVAGRYDPAREHR